MPEFPVSPYHPDPLSTGSAVEEDHTCSSCSEQRPVRYDGPWFGVHAGELTLCISCVVDGSAARTFGIEFSDSVEAVDDVPVPADVLETVMTRTPGFLVWQSPIWLAHCGDAAVFRGRAGADELRAHPEAVAMIRSRCVGMPTTDIDQFVASLHADGDATAYLFQCRRCNLSLAYADMS